MLALYYKCPGLKASYFGLCLMPSACVKLFLQLLWVCILLYMLLQTTNRLDSNEQNQVDEQNTLYPLQFYAEY